MVGNIDISRNVCFAKESVYKQVLGLEFKCCGILIKSKGYRPMSSLKKNWEERMGNVYGKLDDTIRIRGSDALDRHPHLCGFAITSPATVPKAWFLATGKNKI